MVKKRTIQQKSEDESEGVLLTLFKDWIVNPLRKDFGFDFEARLTNDIDGKTQEVSEISFYIQNKSSIKSQKEKAFVQLDADDWLLFLGQKVPVLIVKYDIPQQEFYWEIAQNYLWDIIEKEDPNWRRQKSKRVKLTKKINNLSEIKDAIIECQKRITKYHSLNLGIGEGIRIDQKNLSNLRKVTERALDEYKILSLKEAYYLKKAGDTKTSIKTLENVYNSPKKDEAKLRATIGLVFELNITDLSENQKAVDLANEAIKLAETIDKKYLKDYSIVLRDQAVLYSIITKMCQIQIGLKVQQALNEQSFSLYYFKEFAELDKTRLNIVKEINDSLFNLISHKHIYYYLFALELLIDSISVQVALFSVFNKAIIDQERNLRQSFIAQIEEALPSISEIDLKETLLRSLANYYYYTLRPEKAISSLSEAIDLAKRDDDKQFVEANSKLLKRMEANLDPYLVRDDKEIDEMTVEEYQEMTRKLLVGQGIALDGNDMLTNTISMALRDMNPKPYFQFCEHLHIGYVSTSVVGASIGLPSMGTKIVWCKNCKSSIEAFDLQGAFESFKHENCERCIFLNSRAKDWKCYVKWFKQQENDPEFARGLNKIRQNDFGT